MSKMKSTLAVTVLTLVLTAPTLAGSIGTPGGTLPPPPPPPTSEGGSIGTPGSPTPRNMSSAVSSSPTLVDILIAVFSLF